MRVVADPSFPRQITDLNTEYIGRSGIIPYISTKDGTRYLLGMQDRTGKGVFRHTDFGGAREGETWDSAIREMIEETRGLITEDHLIVDSIAVHISPIDNWSNKYGSHEKVFQAIFLLPLRISEKDMDSLTAQFQAIEPRTPEEAEIHELVWVSDDVFHEYGRSNRKNSMVYEGKLWTHLNDPEYVRKW